MEGGLQEEDSLIQDEIYKSRLASIKRVTVLSFFSFFLNICPHVSSLSMLHTTFSF